ncbi:hypothetical protein [Rathayibacter sp. AY1C1]|uniref:hypothetical protein n=1 Tax=Rathayibacter sp. AY1C1 TaxID=2080534 RepID=UPI0011B03519|nr:hypothetical protein [Rathayibacter sp. AY1C1]
MAKRKTNSSDTTSSDSVLQKNLKRYKDSYDYQKANWHDKWDRDNKLYDQERVHASYVGTTDTFVPIPFSTIETMTSALNNAEIRIDYTSGDPMRKTDIAPLNALIDEYAEDDQWDLNQEDSYREVLKVGMDANMLIWDIDHPHEETFAMRDAIVDPTVKNPAQLQQHGYYAGRRYFVRKGALDDYEVVDTDPKSKTYGELVPRFKKTAEATATTANDEPSDAQLKEMFAGSTLSSAKDDQDEILEIWDVDRVVTIKNRQDVIEDVVNPYKARHEQMLLKRYLDAVPADDAEALTKAQARAKSEAKGIVPFYFYRNYRKKSLFYASSELNAIAKEVERLNDMTNMEGDAIIKQLAMQRELDPDYIDFIDLINDDPGTVYPFKPGSLANIPAGVIPPNSFNNRVDIKNGIREATAISEAANGTLSEKDRTKFEVGSALQQTGARIESKARIFTGDALYWKYWILLKMIQLYVTEPLVVSAPEAKKTGADVLIEYGFDVTAIDPDLMEGVAVFDPADIAGDWKPRITLEVDAESKQAESRKEARETYQAVIQDPTNNLVEAKKRFYPKMFKMDKEDIEAIITPDPALAGLPTDPAALGGAPAPVGVPGV